jgi:hypothetical protein
MRMLRLATAAAMDLLYRRSGTDRIIEAWRPLRNSPDAIKDLWHLGHFGESDINPATGSIYPPDELIARGARKSLVLALYARIEVTEEELHMIRQGDTDGSLHEDEQ